MKSLAVFLGAASILLLLPAAGQADGFRSFFAAREPDILTVTDVTEEGKTWPQPAPGKPIYYEAINYGARNFPGLPGDPAPASDAMAPASGGEATTTTDSTTTTTKP
jgi:hypothetical protein